MECSAASESVRRPASPPGTVWTTSSVTEGVVSASARTTPSVHLYTVVRMASVSRSLAVVTMWTVRMSTPVLAERTDSSSVKTPVPAQSSVGGMLSAPPEVTRPSVRVLMDSLETPTMRRLVVRRSNVW